MKLDADLCECLRDLARTHKSSTSLHVRSVLAAVICEELLGFFAHELDDSSYSVPQFSYRDGGLRFRMVDPDLPDDHKDVDRYRWEIDLKNGKVQRTKAGK